MDTDRTHLRDVSFSSYLSMVGQNDTPSARGPRRGKTSEELGVFEAERYYKMGVVGYDEEDSSRNKLGYIKGDQVMIQTPNRRNKQQQHTYNNNNNFRTPSVSSEGSSQSALMMIKRNKGSSSSLFSGIGCYGRSCSDKDSVLVRKPVRHQIIDPKLTVFDGTKHPIPIHVSRMEDVPRVSIEVFGSNKAATEDQVMLNLERKLSMLTWDAVPKEEIESDASSDLFEIENISSQDGGYEPSIEWSVVTADFSYDESRPRPRPNKGGGGILGCKSYKAVRVVEPLPAPKSPYTPTLPLPSAAHLTRHNQSHLQ